jgi:hypothetical protein
MIEAMRKRELIRAIETTSVREPYQMMIEAKQTAKEPYLMIETMKIREPKYQVETHRNKIEPTYPIETILVREPNDAIETHVRKRIDR